MNGARFDLPRCFPRLSHELQLNKQFCVVLRVLFNSAFLVSQTKSIKSGR